MQLKKILVPVDGSGYSMQAAEYALELAKLIDAEIFLVHCRKTLPSILGEPYYQTAVDDLMEKSNKLVEPYINLFQEAGIKFTDRILEGPPTDIISEVAEIEKCDMIVMGSRGHTNLEGLFLGSVTHRILHTAPCPVLVVR